MRRMLISRTVVAGLLSLLLGAGLFGGAAGTAQAAPVNGYVAASPSRKPVVRTYSVKRVTVLKRYYKTVRYVKYRYVNGRYVRYVTYKRISTYKRVYVYKRVPVRKAVATKVVARTPANVSALVFGNRYARGYCTWWAYERRRQLGKPVPSRLGNANTWGVRARAAGYTVTRTPTRGAVLVKASGRFGHVAVVEQVYGNGSIRISEMMYAGNWNRVTYRTLSAAQARAYSYIA